MTGLGLLTDILIVSGCAIIAYDPRTYKGSQLYMECVDAIVLSIILIIFTIWNFVKPSGYFSPPEILKYKDADEFKNNETVEDLNDNYL